MQDNIIKYRPNIDALRGLSVILVVLFHAFPQIVPGGFVGVDVFFVISGFLITSIICRSVKSETFSFVGFYSKRIKRLFPALALVLLSSLVIGWFLLFPDELEQLGYHAFKGSIYLLNFTLIDEVGYFDVDSQYKPLLHLWSLSVEEQFYVFWPLILFYFLRPTFNVAYFLIVIFFISYSISVFALNSDSAYYHTLSRVWQLAVGAILATNILSSNTSFRWLGFFVGIFFILAYAFSVDHDTENKLAFSVFPVLGAALIISANIKINNWFGFRWLGVISYPLYLWHWMLLSMLAIYVGGQPSITQTTVIVFVSFLLAYLTYRYIEPIRYRSGLTVFLLAIFLLSLGGLGYAIHSSNGLPNRGHLSYLKKHQVQFKRTKHVDETCHKYAKKWLDKRDFYYCRSSFLESEKGLVALIGDSHARAFFPGLAKVARENGMGVLLLANSSCPALIGFPWGKNESRRENCQEKISQIYDVLEKDAKIKKVIIATRGPVYIHGEVQGEINVSNVKSSLASQNAKNPLGSYVALKESLSNSFQFLNTLHHIEEKWYMLENPELDFLPKDVIERPFDILDISGGDDKVSRLAYLLRMEKYRTLVYEASVQLAVKVLDPTPALCGKMECVARKNTTFLYADDDHFSVAGSVYMASFFSRDIFNNE